MPFLNIIFINKYVYIHNINGIIVKKKYWRIFYLQ